MSNPSLAAAPSFSTWPSAMTCRKLVIADLNPELIRAYHTVQQDVETLIDALAEIEAAYLPLSETERKEFYYAQRALQRRPAPRPSPGTRRARSAPRQLIFLNRTCYNGLFRVNASGAFNVPFGRYRQPAHL